MKLRYLIPLAAVVGTVGSVISLWPLYGDYWLRHGVSGVIQRDVIGHEPMIVVAALAGLGMAMWRNQGENR